MVNNRPPSVYGALYGTSNASNSRQSPAGNQPTDRRRDRSRSRSE
jgi:hypothetical protein